MNLHLRFSPIASKLGLSFAACLFFPVITPAQANDPQPQDATRGILAAVDRPQSRTDRPGKSHRMPPHAVNPNPGKAGIVRINAGDCNQGTTADATIGTSVRNQLS